MNEKLKALEESFHDALKGIDTEARLADMKARFLGKKGELSGILGSLKDATPEERKTLGQVRCKPRRALHCRPECFCAKLCSDGYFRRVQQLLM